MILSGLVKQMSCITSLAGVGWCGELVYTVPHCTQHSPTQRSAQSAAAARAGSSEAECGAALPAARLSRITPQVNL